MPDSNKSSSVIPAKKIARQRNHILSFKIYNTTGRIGVFGRKLILTFLSY